MRFAWFSKNSDHDVSDKPRSTSRLVYIAYNLIWWVPVLLAVTRIIDYWTAFIALFVLTFIRAIVNIYRNNVLSPQQAESFPLRSV